MLMERGGGVNWDIVAAAMLDRYLDLASCALNPLEDQQAFHSRYRGDHLPLAAGRRFQFHWRPILGTSVWGSSCAGLPRGSYLLCAVDATSSRQLTTLCEPSS